MANVDPTPTPSNVVTVGGLENYPHLETKDIEDSLDNLGETALVQVKEYELRRGEDWGSGKPRKTLVTAIDERLEAIDASRQEVPVENDPKEARDDAKEAHKAHVEQDKVTEKAEKATAAAVDKAEKKGDPAELPEPFAEGSLREQADLSANDPDVPDPAEPYLNELYVAERDPVEAAIHGESPTASGPDDIAQRMAAAEGAAEALRHEAEVQNYQRPENAGQHVVEAAEADRIAEDGHKEAGPYPLGLPGDGQLDPDLIEARDKETADAKEEQAKEAKKALRNLKGEDGTAAHARDDAPAPPGSVMAGTPETPEWDDEEDVPMFEHDVRPVLGASPQLRPLSVGILVTRLDQAHDEIGVIVDTDVANVNHPMVQVDFPSEKGVWLANNNVSFHGDPQTDEQLAEAYRKVTERSFVQ